MSELPPPIKTSLVGRPAYEPDPDAEHTQPEGRAIPSGCLRKLNVPGGVCEMDCPGRQRDGGCFAELVRGRSEWTVELDRDGYWVVT